MVILVAPESTIDCFWTIEKKIIQIANWAQSTAQSSFFTSESELHLSKSEQMWVKNDSIIDLKVVLCSNSDKNKVILYPLFDHRVVTTKKTS